MTQTVRRQKFLMIFSSGIFIIKFVFSEIILSYTLATGSSATDFSLDDSVTIRFVKIHINWMDKSNELLKMIFV